MSENTYLDVARLKRIVANEKPYRGSKRYPLSSRGHSHKYFLVEELDGETIYRIVYGNISNSEDITRQVYEEMKATKLPPNLKLRDWSYVEGNGTTVDRLYLLRLTPHEMGIVREDNSFEYTGTQYYQGDNLFMSSFLCMDQLVRKAYGGLLLTNSRIEYLFNSETVTTMIPIFKGLRIDLNTCKIHPSCDVKITTRKVDRKAGKEHLDKYLDFYRTTETMMSVMDSADFVELAQEIVIEAGYPHVSYDNYYLGKSAEDKLIETAYKNLHDKPIDSFIMFATAYDANRFWQLLRIVGKGKGKGQRYESLDLNKLFEATKRRLNKEIYKANPSVMKLIEHKLGDYYPPCEWGVDVTLNGVEVEQYRS